MKKKIIRKQLFCVYILECQDGTYYTGYTNNLERRIKEHSDSKRGAKYLRGKKPFKLVYVRKYKYFKRAFKMEKAIKGLTRKQKETLVSGRRLDKIRSGHRRVDKIS
ncbi:MAG: GIY-YIG nuclease family protein [bacterium]|nr:GIY-YIG nuclease family protein [bacterium]